MSCGVYDAAVALHVLQKCSLLLLQRSCPTVWVARADAQTMCWVTLTACVVDRMPCTGVLMPYRANKRKITIRRVLIAQNRKILFAEIRQTLLVSPHAL